MLPRPSYVPVLQRLSGLENCVTLACSRYVTPPGRTYGGRAAESYDARRKQRAARSILALAGLVEL
jgi:hypothetical protein